MLGDGVMVREWDLASRQGGVESLLRSSESGGCALAAGDSCCNRWESIIGFGLLCDKQDWQ